MDYDAILNEVAATADPLFAEVEKLRKQQAKFEEQIATTQQDADRKTQALARHRERAGDKLTESTSAFSEWQGRLRRLTRELDSAEEARRLMQDALLPGTKKKLAAARIALQRALNAHVKHVREAAEDHLRGMMEAVAAERDAFAASRDALYRRFNASSDDEEPRVFCPRLNIVEGVHKTLLGPPWLTFAPPVKRPTLPPPPEPKRDAPAADPPPPRPKRRPSHAVSE